MALLPVDPVGVFPGPGNATGPRGDHGDVLGPRAGGACCAAAGSGAYRGPSRGGFSRSGDCSARAPEVNVHLDLADLGPELTAYYLHELEDDGWW